MNHGEHMTILRALDTHINVMSGLAANQSESPVDRAQYKVEMKEARELRDKLANEWCH